MARTLGSDSNQVAKNGRRVMIGWVGPLTGSPVGFVGSPASQSLSRELSLSENYELLQQFIPEYQQLRQPATFEQTTVTRETAAAEIIHSRGSLQMELVATFTFSANPKAPFGVSVLGGMAEAVVDCSNTTVPNRGEAPGGCMIAVADKSVAGSINASGPVLPVGAKTVTMHIMVDHEIVETIVNNRTAMVTYRTAIPSASSTAVMLVGAGSSSGVTGTVKSWSLDAANNGAPQP
jgi:sucrose-6-phosphate hydrolase SacC (GH32 family)